MIAERERTYVFQRQEPLIWSPLGASSLPGSRWRWPSVSQILRALLTRDNRAPQRMPTACPSTWFEGFYAEKDDAGAAKP